MKINFPLVEVKWLDAQTGFAALMPISEFKQDFKPYYNYSFGYLLEDNKDYLILGFLLMDSEIIDEETGVKHWQLIPKGMVKEIRELKEKKNIKPQKMKQCKGCYHKIMPNNSSGYCYRCTRGKYNKETGKWEGGIKKSSQTTGIQHSEENNGKE